ncbi:MAG: BamA/TamA family outer membrane protein [Vicinamibacterales bacterium]
MSVTAARKRPAATPNIATSIFSAVPAQPGRTFDGPRSIAGRASTSRSRLFLRPRFSLGFTGQQWYTYTPAYNSVASGGKLTLTHRSSQYTSWSASLTSEHDVSSITDLAFNDPKLRTTLIALGLDPTTRAQRGNLNALGADFEHSTADSPLNPHRGFSIALHVEEAGRLVPGSFNYYAASFDGRQYLRMTDNIVFASRVQAGNIRPIGNNPANVPFGKKYFLGGATSIRGWGRYEVGPLVSGQPIGGNSMFAFSEELRATVRGRLSGVMFIDAGNVWAGSGAFNLRDLRYAVGPGLRYETPVGPLRFDLGYQLNPTPDLIVNGNPQRWPLRLHFSIGQAF